MENKLVVLNWSSGKDAFYSLLKLQQNYPLFTVVRLLCSVNKSMQRVSMHGVSKELLLRQVDALGLSVDIMEVDSSFTLLEYEQHLTRVLTQYKTQGIHYFAYGDILLEDIKSFKEQQLSQLGGHGIFPLWKRDTRDLLIEMIDSGVKAVVVCVDAKVLDKSFIGRVIDLEFLSDLPKGVDPCGENGEYHSFVFDGPLFNYPVSYELGDVVYKTYNDADNKTYGFWFLDLL